MRETCWLQAGPTYNVDHMAVLRSSTQSERHTMDAVKKPLTPERRAVERIKRKATAMAIVASADVAPANEVDTAAELEPQARLLPRARSCSCPAADVEAYHEEEEWICHTCGHRLSPYASTLLTLRTRTNVHGRDPADLRPPTTPSPRRITATRRMQNDPARHPPNRRSART
jgi:hypothetical protein